MKAGSKMLAPPLPAAHTAPCRHVPSSALLDVLCCGVLPSLCQALCNQTVELVFTAHPTQAFRQSLLKKYAKVGAALGPGLMVEGGLGVGVHTRGGGGGDCACSLTRLARGGGARFRQSLLKKYGVMKMGGSGQAIFCSNTQCR
jgi:hypothetical protein